MAGIRGKRLSSGNYHKWRAIRAKVIARDNGICQYCGEPGNEADHVVARARGGDDSLENLVCCCRRCNNRKSVTDISVFLGKADTPPVFPFNPSPVTVTRVLSGPFAGQINPEEYLS